jgi:hypothetical protein
MCVHTRHGLEDGVMVEDSHDAQGSLARTSDAGSKRVVVVDKLDHSHGSVCRFVRLCGVGPSGVPSCTPEVEAGTRGSHQLRLESNTLKIVPRSQTSGTDDQARSVCPVERDSYQVSFP